MITTTKKSVNASFESRPQRALEKISKETLNAFLSSGHSTPATDEEKREHVYEDHEVRTLENILQ